MKVTIDRITLVKVLKLTEKAGTSKSTLPILMCTRLQATVDRLIVTATNLERGVTVTAKANVEDIGAIAIPTKLFSDVCNRLDGDTITLELNARTMTLLVSTQRAKVQIKGLDAADFPLVPTLEDMQAQVGTIMVPLATDGLKQMVDQVVFCASTDASRPLLTGVSVVVGKEDLTMAATDGYRLSRRRVVIPEQAMPITCIVPASSLSEFARIAEAVGDKEIPAQLAFSPNQLLARVTGKYDATPNAIQQVDIVTQLLDGRFPDYAAIIPKSHTVSMTIDTSVLKKAIDLAMLFAVDHANIISIYLHPESEMAGDAPQNMCTVAATSSELGESNDLIPAVSVNGNDLEISFNGKYVNEMLAQLPGTQLVLTATQATRPGTFTVMGMPEDELLYVIMPMHPSQR